MSSTTSPGLALPNFRRTSKMAWSFRGRPHRSSKMYGRNSSTTGCHGPHVSRRPNKNAPKQHDYLTGSRKTLKTNTRTQHGRMTNSLFGEPAMASPSRALAATALLPLFTPLQRECT